MESIGVGEFRWDQHLWTDCSPFKSIGVHWSPLELDNSDGINIFWTLWSLSLEPIGVGEFRWGHHFLDTVVFTIGAHWSPLELEIVDEGKINKIKKLLTIGAHWSRLELEISEVFRFLDTST